MKIWSWVKECLRHCIISRWLNLMIYIYIWNRNWIPSLGNSRLWCSGPVSLTSGACKQVKGSNPDPNEKMAYLKTPKKYIGPYVGVWTIYEVSLKKSYKVEIKKSLYDLSRWLNLMNYIYIWKRIRLPALGNSRLWCSSPFVLTNGRLQANEGSKPNPNEKMSIWCSKKIRRALRRSGLNEVSLS
jgi:hypothetical protein